MRSVPRPMQPRSTQIAAARVPSDSSRVARRPHGRFGRDVSRDAPPFLHLCAPPASCRVSETHQLCRLSRKVGAVAGTTVGVTVSVATRIALVRVASRAFRRRLPDGLRHLATTPFAARRQRLAGTSLRTAFAGTSGSGRLLRTAIARVSAFSGGVPVKSDRASLRANKDRFADRCRSPVSARAKRSFANIQKCSLPRFGDRRRSDFLLPARNRAELSARGRDL